ncbi:hypothetical protein PMAYCL1PPCAC_22622, partial [Pristionchus mayeri]
ITIIIEVTGHLTCPRKFKARVNVWDDDEPFRPGALDPGVRPYKNSNYNQLSASHEVFFKLYGTVSEDWAEEKEVEPVLTIEHNCASGIP